MRPGGPAEPPGPSAGARVVAEWMASKQWVRPPSADAQDDLGRRIDAALAERNVVFKCPACGLIKGRIHDLHGLEAALAEREAQCTALREALVEALSLYGTHSTHAIAVEGRRVLTSTADAAARCVERARQEGAEEMRERCAAYVDGWLPPGTVREYRDRLAAAIRALDAGALASRRR